MAYIYANMDALIEYQKQIVQTLSLLEQQARCKDEFVEETLEKIHIAIQRAEEAEQAARISLQAAYVMLEEAEQRTRDYNQQLTENEAPITTPSHYYENASAKEEEHDRAEAVLIQGKNILSNFEEYVRSYNQRQTDSILHFKKLLDTSGQFFQNYIKLLVEAKKCTAVNCSRISTPQSTTAGTASGAINETGSPELSVKEAGKQWAEGLSKEQHVAISFYTGSGYININSTLRGISPAFDDGNREKAILIHQALNESYIPQACIVYRGASAAALGALQNVPDNQLVGAFFGDKGFMSTSMNYEDSFGGEIKFIIDVPAGAKGAYVGYVSQLGHSESEVLFDVGRVMQITKVDHDDSGGRVIHAKMMI